MATIVILGAGIGGVPCAYEMRQRLGKEHRIVLVGENPRFEFTPSNPWIAVGWRNTIETGVDLARPLQRRDIEFLAQEAVAIDAPARRLKLADGSELAYDYLVITTGGGLAFDEIPGLGPAGHTQSICTHAHAEQAWNAYQRFLENPGPVVIGAAPGASCFGPAYEFAMILDADLRKRRLRDRVPITFVTSEPWIGHMGLAGVGDSKTMMESEFRQAHIQWITNARITRVEEDRLHAEEVDSQGETIRKHELPFAYSTILPAFRGVEAVSAVPGLCNERGFVLIDDHQRSPAYPEIYAAGVCVAIPPVEATPVPTGAPKTGYMIESMVTATCLNIQAAIEGRQGTATATWNAICLADFGDTGVAFVALPQIPPRNVTWARKGRWVHLGKIVFEKYFLRKVRSGAVAPVYETYVLKALGITRLKDGSH